MKGTSFVAVAILWSSLNCIERILSKADFRSMRFYGPLITVKPSKKYYYGDKKNEFQENILK
jgi:hypothetical protein